MMLQTASPAARRMAVAAAKPGRGFGKPASPKPSAPKERRPGCSSSRPRRKTQWIEDEPEQRQPSNGAAIQSGAGPSDAAQRQVEQRFRNSAEAQQRGEAGGSDSDFERRVSQLAQSAPQPPAEQRQQKQQQPAEQRDVLAMSPQFTQPAASPAANDAQDEKPLWLVQAGGTAFALVLLAIFVVSSIAGGGGSPPASSGGAAPELSEQQHKDLQAQAQRFEEQLAASPDSVEALEGAAVSVAKLGDLEKATPLLQRLTQAKGQDPEVWRLLAETQSLQGDFASAAATYGTATAKAGGTSIELLSAWTNALLAAGKPQKAVEVVRAARRKTAQRELAVDLDLLLGRVWSQFKGHNGEALALYDQLAEAHPDDFRPPLAKALVLKREGRKGDAARYAMKARYLAPASARQAIEELVQQ